MSSPNKKNPVPICQLTALVWVLAIFLTAIPLFAISPAGNQRSVYCPLQKQWVKRNEEKKIVSSLPLSDLCAGGNDKTAFLQKLLSSGSKLGSSQKIDLDELFFTFVAKGDQVFAQLPSSPQTPRVPLAFVDKLLGGIVATRVFDVAAISQVFSLEQSARPPTHSVDRVITSLAPKGQKIALVSASLRGPPAV